MIMHDHNVNTKTETFIINLTFSTTQTNRWHGLKSCHTYAMYASITPEFSECMKSCLTFVCVTSNTAAIRTWPIALVFANDACLVWVLNQASPPKRIPTHKLAIASTKPGTQDVKSATSSHSKSQSQPQRVWIWHEERSPALEHRIKSVCFLFTSCRHSHIYVGLVCHQFFHQIYKTCI